ncbi:MAG: hypothetical protein LBT09_01020 [Planctomycetaceae bacterium]|nr:hypothetical protein [Planctomycetaceae bacterium]
MHCVSTSSSPAWGESIVAVIDNLALAGLGYHAICITVGCATLHLHLRLCISRPCGTNKK